ncbi:MAG: circularly permuted type 2 ATP-grasp protein [Pseudomonadota bacterium]
MSANAVISAGNTEIGKSWLEGYAPPSGGWDECVDANGQVRPHWRDAIDIWEHRGAEGRARRRSAADRYLRDNGVGHRIYGDGEEAQRPWPLSHVPLIIDADEWAMLQDGLIQRAHLLEAVIADLYGPQKLIRDGALPAPLVAASPGFLRPLVGVEPLGGYHLHTIAVELGRGPDGRWWVLGDRTQAPSGMGYALENRIALSRGVGNDLTELQVERLAPFFQTLRATLGGMSSPQTARVGLLTPGLFSQTYYEQAFLARYLGFLLLEGGDLIMQDDALFIRTVRGLRPLDVLWRRLDADFCDPLELRGDSQLGVPGLVRAVRAGNLVCANALGAGLLESRFFMAFAPALSRRLLHEVLRIPNIATWWLGDERAAARAQSTDVATVRLSAVGSGLPVDGAQAIDQPISGSQGVGQLPDALSVMQEVVRLSTLPSRAPLDDGGSDVAAGVSPRPCTLRVFLVRNGPDWVVMPGGFCRVAETADTRALSMQDGSRSADVWVRSANPIAPASLLPSPSTVSIRRLPGTLPARAADNLFWLGRYAERAQLSIRLTRAHLNRRLEGEAFDDPTLAFSERQLALWGVKGLESDDLFERALMPNIDRAHQAASSIRDRFSPDAWQILNRFVDQNGRGELRQLGALERADAALTMLAAFTGLIADNMVRLIGWRFLKIGQRLERAIGTNQLAQTLLDPKAPREALDLLLEVADSTMSYRQRYSVQTEHRSVADIVILDPNNPRSVVFQLERMHRHINEITDHKAFDQTSDLQKQSFGLWANLHALSIEDLPVSAHHDLDKALNSLSQAISDTYLIALDRRGNRGGLQTSGPI